MLLNQVPTVLRFEIYASAAMVGSVCMIVLMKVRFPAGWAAGVGAFACFTLRVVSLWKHWNLPHALGQ